MRTLLMASLALVLLGSAASADQFVNGYMRRDGTYVQPHMRSSPDSTPLNNWSTQGNVNPYTGAVGTRSPYNSGSGYGSPSPSFGSPTYNPYGYR